ncbi:insulinase family protein [Pseudohalocynthiibacter aestuariivivens]|nr:pitrilysin family protein [Pseudohalocynthiibacter aestuariivivens]QIE47542.1 insulinase family protein [Pseudohalocynthiibacter aestuariivivens]
MSRLMALLSLVCAPFAAQADDQVTNFTLDNGMDVVVIEDHRAPVVVNMVWYRAGSADEPPGSSGVAHFLEHLLFKGTKTLEPGEFSATVSRNGGNDNAFTSYDFTAYYQRVAADRLELMMRMESDRMVNLQIGPEDIATERDVIIEERNQRIENNASALFREQRNAAQYLNHRYGVPIIGWQHEMRALDLKKAKDFYNLYYSPNNAILVVAGDVYPDDVKALAEKYYGVIPANLDLPERIRPQEPRQMAERRLIFEDPRVAQPYVSRSYLAPERDSGAQDEAAALSLLAEILGGGITSVMTEKLQFDAQIAVQSQAWYDATSLDDTTFDLIVVPVAGVTLAEAEDAMDRVIAEFLETGIDEEQLDRIKMGLRASQIYARDDVNALANRYGSALTQGLTIADVQEWPDILQATTSEQIMAAARNVFQRKNAVTGYLTAPEVTQ